MRIRLEPRKGNRQAEEMFRYHLHRDGYVHVSERLDRWYVFHQMPTQVFGYTQQKTLTGLYTNEPIQSCLLEGW